MVKNVEFRMMHCIDLSYNKGCGLLEVMGLPCGMVAPVKLNRVGLVWEGTKNAEGVKFDPTGLHPFPHRLNFMVSEELQQGINVSRLLLREDFTSVSPA